MTLRHQGEVQRVQSMVLPGWFRQGGPGWSFLGCRWWGELSTGSPSQWWSHQCCWWKHLLTSLPCPSQWQQAWMCPAFEDLSNKNLETEQRVKWNEAEAVEIIHLPIASDMDHAASSAPGSLLRWASVPNLSRPLPLASLNYAAQHHVDIIVWALCAVVSCCADALLNSRHFI